MKLEDWAKTLEKHLVGLRVYLAECEALLSLLHTAIDERKSAVLDVEKQKDILSAAISRMHQVFGIDEVDGFEIEIRRKPVEASEKRGEPAEPVEASEKRGEPAEPVEASGLTVKASERHGEPAEPVKALPVKAFAVEPVEVSGLAVKASGKHGEPAEPVEASGLAVEVLEKRGEPAEPVKAFGKLNLCKTCGHKPHYGKRCAARTGLDMPCICSEELGDGAKTTEQRGAEWAANALSALGLNRSEQASVGDDNPKECSECGHSPHGKKPCGTFVRRGITCGCVFG